MGEATSGRTASVETLQMHTGVFHDREYSFDSLGDFQGKTFIKYSNDDKMTDKWHVMTKIRTLEPLTVYIVKLVNDGLPWLADEGFMLSGYTGVAFSGVRSIRHKEWDETLLTTDHFGASSVHKKTYPAGTISIPGNNGGDGSFLIFLDRPGEEPAAPQYQRLAYGAANCPAGKEINTHAECELAHIALGLEVEPKWVGTLSSIPGLCSTREVDAGGLHHFHFNSQSVGTSRGDLAPVCKM